MYYNAKYSSKKYLLGFLLLVVFPTLVKDDSLRRGIKNPEIFWIISFIPLFGALIYLYLRSSLSEENQLVGT